MTAAGGRQAKALPCGIAILAFPSVGNLYPEPTHPIDIHAYIALGWLIAGIAGPGNLDVDGLRPGFTRTTSCGRYMSRPITQRTRALPVPQRTERTTAQPHRPASPSCTGP
jgi:hypothetical protein